MPETAVNEYYRLIFTQNQIRFAGQILPVQTKTKSFMMKKLADYLLRLCVLRANAAHDTASFAFRKSVHSDLSTD